MLKGHDLAESRKSYNAGFSFEMLIKQYLLSRMFSIKIQWRATKWKVQDFRSSEIYWKPSVMQYPNILEYAQNKADFLKITSTFKWLSSSGKKKKSRIWSLLDINREHNWKSLPEILTAQFGSPVQRLSTSMSTLPWVFSKGVAHAEVSHRGITVA